MILSITLSPEAEAKLREKAAASGESLDAYAARLLERAATSPTVAEILAPAANSGLPDLTAFRASIAERGRTSNAPIETLRDQDRF